MALFTPERAAAARDGIKVLGGAWVATVLAAMLVELLAVLAAPGRPYSTALAWFAAIAGLAMAPLVLAIYAGYRRYVLQRCAPPAFLLAYLASLLLLDAVGLERLGGAGGSLSLAVGIVGTAWLLLLALCLLGLRLLPVRRGG